MDTGPPKPIPQDSIVLRREVDPSTGKVVSRYVDASGQEVGLAPCFHLMTQASGRFIPPAS